MPAYSDQPVAACRPQISQRHRIVRVIGRIRVSAPRTQNTCCRWSTASRRTSFPTSGEKRSVLARRVTFASGGDFDELIRHHIENVSRVFSRVFGETGNDIARDTNDPVVTNTIDRIRSEVLASIEKSDYESAGHGQRELRARPLCRRLTQICVDDRGQSAACRITSRSKRSIRQARSTKMMDAVNSVMGFGLRPVSNASRVGKASDRHRRPDVLHNFDP